MTTPYTYLIGWTSLKLFYYGRRTAKNCQPSDLWKSYFTSSSEVKKIVSLHGDPDIIQVRKEFSGNTSEKIRIKMCAEWENRVLRRLHASKNPKFINKSDGDAKFNSSGMVTAFDLSSNQTCQVTVEEFKRNQSRYIGILKGHTIAINLETGVTAAVKLEEYRKNKHLYKHPSKDNITVILISSNKRVTISTKEFHNNRHLYKHHSEGITLSNEVREKMSKSHIGKLKSKTHKENISKALTGIIRSPEHIENLKRSRKPAYKAVVVNGIFFHSVNAAAAHFNVNHSAISNRLAGRKKLNEKFWEVRYA